MLVRKFTMMVAGGIATMVLVAQGCRTTVPNPRHCNNNEGDEYCNREFGSGEGRLYCEQGTPDCITPDSEYGCVAARPADECYSPCGGRSTLAENGECVMGEESSGSSSGTATVGSSGSGSESSTTGPVPCVGNEDCPDAAAPFCELGSGECVACDGVEDSDGACAGLDPGLPVCEGGACVACTPENPAACTGTTPICDGGTNSCVPCTAHDQCGPAACNLYTGACLPVDEVVHVGGLTPDFDRIADAVGSFGVDEEGTVIVHAGMADYNEAVTVSTGRTIAILAAEIGPEIEPPRWIRSSGSVPQLTVEAGTTVLVDGLQLSGNASSDDPAVLVDGGRAWLDRSRVVDNNGGGIVAQSNAELVLRNCFVGDGTNGEHGVSVDGSSAYILSSTVGAGVDNFADVFAIYCNGSVDVTIRNSFLVSFDNLAELSCSTAMVMNTASEATIPGMGNAALGDVGMDWFVGVEAGDFHLDNPPATLGTVALRQAGDPPTDIDGDPRPADGTPDHAGADVPVMAAARPEAGR